jgi:uncharacterized protein (DUF58 family)
VTAPATSVAAKRSLARSIAPGARSRLERVGLTVPGAAVTGLAVLVWWAARATGARAIYFLAYGGLAVMAMSWMSGRRAVRLLVDRSELPLRMRCGQTIDVSVTIGADRRATTVVIEETVPPELGQTAHIPIAAISPGETLEHTYVLKPTLRGVYEVGPAAAVWSDPFGLTVHRHDLAEPVEVLVHPATERVHDRVLTRMWEDPPVRPPVSKPWPVGFEFYGMRDYVPGDDLRRVVWSVLARSGRMMVRESEQGITDKIVVYVDNHAEFHSPGTPSVTFESAVSTAASLGTRHLDDGFSVSLYAGQGVVAAGLRGGRAKMELLDALARMRMDGEALADAGRHLITSVQGRVHMVVLTPRLDDAAAARLRMLIDRGASVVVATLLWDETDPLSSARAAALGCQVVELRAGLPLEVAFAHGVGAGARR